MSLDSTDAVIQCFNLDQDYFQTSSTFPLPSFSKSEFKKRHKKTYTLQIKCKQDEK